MSAVCQTSVSAPATGRSSRDRRKSASLLPAPSPAAPIRPLRHQEAENTTVRSVGQWEADAAAIARRATRRTSVMPGIAAARFRIAGTPEAPELEAHVDIRAGADFAAAVDWVMEQILPEMESALGTSFVENHVEFDVAGPRGKDRGAPALSIV